MKTFRKSAFTSVCALILAIPAWAQSAEEQSPYSVEAAVAAARSTPKMPELPGQVFLRNYFEFKGDRVSGGASSSLVIKGDKVYILTAKHLLGEAMGVSPEVLPTDFDAAILGWAVYFNNEEDLLAVTHEIYRPNDDMDEDLIMLKTDLKPKKVKKHALTLAKTKPLLSERVYIIGCPYSEEDKCQQNIYPAKITQFSNLSGDESKPNNLAIMEAENPPDSLAGFSGAAMINQKGEVYGVVFGGGEGEIYATILPDWAKN